MQRILERGQIESSSHGAIARVRRPDPENVFAERAERLRSLSTNHAIGDYLRLMASLCDVQHQLAIRAPAPLPESPSPVGSAEAHASLRDLPWREALREILAELLSQSILPSAVHGACERLTAATPDMLQTQAETLLGMRGDRVDAASAPFIMAALQVCWTRLAAESEPRDYDSKSPGGCPICDASPVASIVHVAAGAEGYRYLYCSLCASEWHYVRALCTHCGSGKSVSYQSIEGASQALRAECCDECHHYRKVAYREHDALVEPLADDLASLALDLLLSEAGYRRSSGNPLLWQP
jgi:FdhE protein